tara:strand:- start:340 stop:834 length:495 start_codon:yes stop_codon:yes gene_type:complete
MKNYLLSSLLLFSTGFVVADGHSVAEKEVISKISQYWDARNSADWSSVVSMSSATGMLNTNSDGSFHKPKSIQTVADWENQSAGGTGVITVHAPEAYQLNKDTVYVRYYAEGVVPSGNGGIKPYRTRVTGVWVNEKGNWVAKTMHFSSAAYGGTHQTVAADFED